MVEGEDIPPLFGELRDSLVYYHSHITSPEHLEKAEQTCPLFEIDLAWAHSTFIDSIPCGSPFIGHPEEFYTKMGHEFPSENVTLDQFQSFMTTHTDVKLLIDIKDDTTYMASNALEVLILSVGAPRCIVHAFIHQWTMLPEGSLPEPHTYREDVNLHALDQKLTALGVPLIANCRGFSIENVEANNIVETMINDALLCESIVSLGIYLPAGSPAPDVRLLRAINNAGYYAWVNGNAECFEEDVLDYMTGDNEYDDGMTDCSDSITDMISVYSDSSSIYDYNEWKDLKFIAMSDDITRCTSFRSDTPPPDQKEDEKGRWDRG